MGGIADGKKIPPHLECPIDNHFIDSCRWFFPWFRKWGFTANTLTTLSFLCGLVTLIAIWKNAYLWAGFWYLISYWFDCCDGNYARTYNQVTVFGDWYDHITDAIVSIGLILLLLYQRHYWLVMVVLFMALFGLFQLMLQECLHDQEAPTLAFLYRLIRRLGWQQEECHRYIQTVRYLGMGVLTVIIVLGLLWLGLR